MSNFKTDPRRMFFLNTTLSSPMVTNLWPGKSGTSYETSVLRLHIHSPTQKAFFYNTYSIILQNNICNFPFFCVSLLRALKHQYLSSSKGGKYYEKATDAYLDCNAGSPIHDGGYEFWRGTDDGNHREGDSGVLPTRCDYQEGRQHPLEQ